MAARPFSSPLIASKSIAVELAPEISQCNCSPVGRDQHTKKGRTSLERVRLQVNITPNSQNGQALEIILLDVLAEMTKVVKQVVKQKLKDSTPILSMEDLGIGGMKKGHFK